MATDRNGELLTKRGSSDNDETSEGRGEEENGSRSKRNSDKDRENLSSD